MGLARGDQGARRRRCRDIGDDERHRDHPQPPSAQRVASATAAISLSLLLHDVTDIASSSLRELDAVALATNVTVFMERGTKRIFSAPLYEPTIWSLAAPGWTRTESRSISAFSRILTTSLSSRISHTPFSVTSSAADLAASQRWKFRCAAGSPLLRWRSGSHDSFPWTVPSGVVGGFC